MHLHLLGTSVVILSSITIHFKFLSTVPSLLHQVGAERAHHRYFLASSFYYRASQPMMEPAKKLLEKGLQIVGRL